MLYFWAWSPRARQLWISQNEHMKLTSLASLSALEIQQRIEACSVYARLCNAHDYLCLYSIYKINVPLHSPKSNSQRLKRCYGGLIWKLSNQCLPESHISFRVYSIWHSSCRPRACACRIRWRGHAHRTLCKLVVALLNFVLEFPLQRTCRVQRASPETFCSWHICSFDNMLTKFIFIDSLVPEVRILMYITGTYSTFVCWPCGTLIWCHALVSPILFSNFLF